MKNHLYLIVYKNETDAIVGLCRAVGHWDAQVMAEDHLVHLPGYRLSSVTHVDEPLRPHNYGRNAPASSVVEITAI